MWKLKAFFVKSHLQHANIQHRSDNVFYSKFGFFNYFENGVETLDAPILQNWTTQEQVLPISLQAFEINSNLLNAPKC